MIHLLTRDNFREEVFKRDNYKCVICGSPAQDAHHILERRLWKDGGYYLENGASLCGVHHLQAEKTILSCATIREKAGIDKIVIPEHLYEEYFYDKWGNIVLSNGTRLKGDLFFDTSVQKILKAGGVLDSFSEYIKYPRTYHLPWSGTISSDDKVLRNTSHFEGKDVVATVKMDGEQFSLYRDYIHARSLDSRTHPSRDWVKNLHSKIAYLIPENWRVCGENLFAKHTIHYKNLKDYFMVFSIWNERNECLSWKETMEWADLLDLKYMPIIWFGKWNEERIKNLYMPSYEGDRCEGYVVRLMDGFSYADFKNSTAKYVHEDFRNDLKGRHHWMYQQITKNTKI